MRNFVLLSLVLFSTTLFAQTWVQVANAPLSRHHPISFSLNGKGYAVTGTNSSSNPTDDVLEYDPIADTWTALANFPGAARGFGIGTAADNGLAYLGFGATTTQYLNDFWSFDAGTGTWTQLTSCGCSGRRHPAMIAIGDRIYVGLGDNSSGDQNDWWMYDIPSDTWTQTASLPGPARHHPYMFNAGDQVFAGFGHSGGTIYKDWYKLDTATNTWTAMTIFQGEARVAGTQFSWNGLGYVLSGDGDNHSYMQTGEMWSYNPVADTWQQLTPHPGESRWAPGSFAIGNEVFFFGGYNRFTGLYPNDTWKFGLGTPTDIEENAPTNISVYPNPANETISWNNYDNITNVAVYNALGQLVVSSPASAKQINTQELSNGLHFVHFYDNTSLVSTSKVLIQH
jgi:N-acetylneuraminic acid mutarotase